MWLPTFIIIPDVADHTFCCDMNLLVQFNAPMEKVVVSTGEEGSTDKKSLMKGSVLLPNLNPSKMV